MVACQARTRWLFDGAYVIDILHILHEADILEDTSSRLVVVLGEGRLKDELRGGVACLAKGALAQLQRGVG